MQLTYGAVSWGGRGVGASGQAQGRTWCVNWQRRHARARDEEVANAAAGRRDTNTGRIRSEVWLLGTAPWYRALRGGAMLSQWFRTGGGTGLHAEERLAGEVRRNELMLLLAGGRVRCRLLSSVGLSDGCAPDRT